MMSTRPAGHPPVDSLLYPKASASCASSSWTLPAPELKRSGKPRISIQLSEPYRCLSWAVHGGGFQTVRELLWLQVTNSDLSEKVCPRAFIAAQLQENRSDEEAARDNGLDNDKAKGVAFDQTVFLTSARLESYREFRVIREGIEVIAVATVGLGNALRAGDPESRMGTSRTINLACLVNVSMTDNAMLEALSIMTEAKTAAILEAGILSKQSGFRATGTGTDCQAVLCPIGFDHDYAGKHTVLGRVIGEASLAAINLGITAWQEWQEHHRTKTDPSGPDGSRPERRERRQ